MLAQYLLKYFSSNSTFKLVVMYDKKIKDDNFEEHSHEEVDTLIPHQVLSSVSENALRNIRLVA